jgi:fluoride exporter
MWRAALVAVGGLVGSLGRYWLAGLAQRWNGAEFPVGTLTVNVVGSFLLGLVMVLSLERGLLSPGLRTFLAVGFCGGFTTMSTFSYETVALLRGGDGALALGNVALTTAACLAAVWLGDVVARLL